MLPRTLRRLMPSTAGLPTPLRRIDVPDDLASVTTRAEEVEPTRAGLATEGVERIWRAVRRLYRWGMHPAVALCLRRDGHVVLDRAIGHARPGGVGGPGVEPVLATPRTPFVLASASKAVTAVVVHLLDERGRLHIGDRVCDHVPEFRAHGKQHITINHVLSHRAGVPHLPPEALDLDRVDDHEYALGVLSDARPLWRPGRFVAYHAISGGFILAEVVRRATGRDIGRVLEEELLAPLGFEWMRYGVDPADVPAVASNRHTGLPVVPPISGLLRRALGVGVQEATRILNDERFLTGVVPAANIVATANEASRFFELLRRGGTLDGVGVLGPRTLRRALTEQSYMEVDLTLGFPFRYARGFMLGADTVSLYGPRTRTAFGHLGLTNIVVWSDPERRVSGALLTSGTPVLGPHLLDLWRVMRTITEVCPADGLSASPVAGPR